MPNTAFWTDKRPAPKCSSHALKAAPQQSPSGRLRNSKTPWPWRTERPPKTCCPEAWRPFWILVKTKRLQLLGLLLLLLLLVLLELVPNVAFWADKKPAPKCSSRALKAAPQQSPSGRLRNSKTPGPWRTERPPKTCFPGAWRPFWILVKTKRLQLLGLLLLLLLLLLVVLLELVPNVAFWTDKKPAPKRSSHGLKAAPQQSPSGRLGNSKTPWHWKTKAAPSKQAPMPNVAFWTDKKPAPKCSFHALKAAPQQSPSGRLRNSKTPWPWRTERPPKTCCPGAWRPFWILVKTKRLQLLGLLLLLLLLLLVVVLLELVRNVAFWTDKKPAPKCSSHALKAAPQQSPSGRLRNSKTPWPWRTERACGHLTLPSEPTRNQLQSAAPMPSKQLHNEVLAGGCETAKHHGPEGRKRRVESNIAFWTDKKLAPKRSSHAFTAAPQRSPIARGCEKAKHHGTERRKRRPASRLQCLTLPSEATRNHLQSAAPMPSKQLHNEVLAGGCETAKHHVALKDGTTSKNMLSRGLTSLLDSGKNKAISAAGPAAAAPAAAGGAAGAGAKRCLLNRQETSFKVQLPCPQSSSTTKS